MRHCLIITLEARLIGRSACNRSQACLARARYGAFLLADSPLRDVHDLRLCCSRGDIFIKKSMAHPKIHALR
jgi:hypothetical protein